MTQPHYIDREAVALLEDKLNLWEKAATSGNTELRDYNRRCADALRAVLSRAPAPMEAVAWREKNDDT